MRKMLDLRSRLEQVFVQTGEPGFAELWNALSELPTIDGFDRIVGFQQLKRRVFRLTVATGSGQRSVVLKRLEPGVAQRNRLVAEQWLTALGLGDHCARLLGVASARRGDYVWHVYEDLGDETLAAHYDPVRIRATVDFIAEMHTRAANHGVLPDLRRYAGNLGSQYFVANVRDAIAALEALSDAAIESPPEFAGVTDRLLDRLVALRDDAPRRTRVFEEAAGPDTLLHGDLWPINVFVSEVPTGWHVRLVDWDKAGVGPFSYDLSTFLFRFPPAQRAPIVSRYRTAIGFAGRQLADEEELQLLVDTAERARYANRVIWPVLALLQQRAAWAFPELAEVERWFNALDSNSPMMIH
jgi:Phosphotransferase enzyme family